MTCPISLATKCRLSFAPIVAQPTGAGPAVVTSGDFNGDGRQDLAVANYDESTTSILLGNGHGTFQPLTKLSHGVNARTNGIAVGDLNNDARLDLVVVNSGTSNIGILLGQGDGRFSQQSIYTIGTNSSPVGLVLTDLNGDRVLDLVVSDHTNHRLFVSLGNGDGTFTNSKTLPTGQESAPYSIVAHDFNRDSHVDLAVSNSGSNSVGIFLGDGTGNFGGQRTYPTGASPNTLVAADFDRDGLLDLVTANYLGNSTSVLLGKGDGSFGRERRFSTGRGSLPFAIDSGDFDGDNFQDLIVANSGSDTIGILLGYGNGRFRAIQTYSTGSNSYPDDVAVGDFNGDNRLDFVSGNYRQGTVSHFMNTCS